MQDKLVISNLLFKINHFRGCWIIVDTSLLFNMPQVLFTPDERPDKDRDIVQLKPFSVYNSSSESLLPMSLVAVVAANGAIGRDGDLLWHIPEDLRHFKEVTAGGTVIMGRKTWESLPKKPLPGRLNIVMTRRKEYDAEGAVVASSLEEAVEKAKDNEIFVIGGGEIYDRFLPWASKLILTEVALEVEDADTFFPPFDRNDWDLVEKSEPKVSAKGIPYSFNTYVRK